MWGCQWFTACWQSQGCADCASEVFWISPAVVAGKSVSASVAASWRSRPTSIAATAAASRSSSSSEDAAPWLLAPLSL